MTITVRRWTLHEHTSFWPGACAGVSLFHHVRTLSGSWNHQVFPPLMKKCPNSGINNLLTYCKSLFFTQKVSFQSWNPGPTRSQSDPRTRLLNSQPAGVAEASETLTWNTPPLFFWLRRPCGADHYHDAICSRAAPHCWDAPTGETSARPQLCDGSPTIKGIN